MAFRNLQVKSIKYTSGIYKSVISSILQESASQIYQVSFRNLQVNYIKYPSGIYKSNLSSPLQESTKTYPSSHNQVINLWSVSSYPCLTFLCYFSCFHFFLLLMGPVLVALSLVGWIKYYWPKLSFSVPLFMEIIYPFFKRQIVYATVWFFFSPLPLGRPHSIFEGSPSVCCIFMCQNNGMAANTWDFLMSTQVLMNLIARGGCTKTLRVYTESKPSAKISLAAPGSQTWHSTMPDQRSVNRASSLHCWTELNKWTVHSWRDGGAEQEHSLLKAMLSTNECGHHTDGWTLCARLCAHPESSLESKYSVQTLQL